LILDEDSITAECSGKYNLLQAIKKNIPDMGKLDDYFKGVERRLNMDWNGRIEDVRNMRQHFRDGTDQLFHYKYLDENRVEIGWLILRDGTIFKKFPLGQGISTRG
jgi:hypothetical protein